MSATFCKNIRQESDTDINVSNSNLGVILYAAGLPFEQGGEIEFDRFLWGFCQAYLGYPERIEAAKALVEDAKASGLTKLYFG